MLFLVRVIFFISGQMNKIKKIKATKYNTCGTGSDTSLYVGCYYDFYLMARHFGRDLDGLGLYTTNTVGGGSIATCIAHCKSLNFAYAGLQNG